MSADLRKLPTSWKRQKKIPRLTQPCLALNESLETKWSKPEALKIGREGEMQEVKASLDTIFSHFECHSVSERMNLTETALTVTAKVKNLLDITAAAVSINLNYSEKNAY